MCLVMCRAGGDKLATTFYLILAASRAFSSTKNRLRCQVRLAHPFPLQPSLTHHPQHIPSPLGLWPALPRPAGPLATHSPPVRVACAGCNVLARPCSTTPRRQDFGDGTIGTGGIPPVLNPSRTTSWGQVVDEHGALTAGHRGGGHEEARRRDRAAGRAPATADASPARPAGPGLTLGVGIRVTTCSIVLFCCVVTGLAGSLLVSGRGGGLPGMVGRTVFR